MNLRKAINAKFLFWHFPKIKLQTEEIKMTTNDDPNVPQSHSGDSNSSLSLDKAYELSQAIMWADKKQLAVLLLANPEDSIGFMKLLFSVDASIDGIDPACYHPYEPLSGPISLLCMLECSLIYLVQ